ncbi:MAG: hypothetical protein K1060chlam2_01046 [Chlamydiae bacterium]|nr:hypothetical protein [Chlamydiota bacterium]
MHFSHIFDDLENRTILLVLPLLFIKEKEDLVLQDRVDFLRQEGRLVLSFSYSLKSEKILSYGGAFKFQRRWDTIPQHSPSKPFIIYGVSAMASLKF